MSIHPVSCIHTDQHKQPGRSAKGSGQLRRGGRDVFTLRLLWTSLNALPRSGRTPREPPICARMGVHLTGVHLMGVYLMGVHLTGVYLIGVHFTGVHHRMQPFLLSRTYVFAAGGSLARGPRPKATLDTKLVEVQSGAAGSDQSPHE